MIIKFASNKFEKAFFDHVTRGCMILEFIEIYKTKEKGFALRNSGDKSIKKGQIILQVPHKIWSPFSAEYAEKLISENSQYYDQVLEIAKERFSLSSSSNAVNNAAQLRTTVCFAIMLSTMLGSGECSYLKLLESSIPTHPIVDRNMSASSLLSGTQTGKAIEKRYAFYESVTEDLFNSKGSIGINRRTFKWSIGIILSRGISGPETPLTLVPLLDFVNHCSKFNAKHIYSKAKSEFELIATSDIKPGDEITISYGEQRDNTSMMSLYGFHDVFNPNDKLSLLVQVKCTSNNGYTGNTSLLERWCAQYLPLVRAKGMLCTVLNISTETYLKLASEDSNAARLQLTGVPDLRNNLNKKIETQDQHDHLRIKEVVQSVETFNKVLNIPLRTCRVCALSAEDIRTILLECDRQHKLLDKNDGYAPFSPSKPLWDVKKEIEAVQIIVSVLSREVSAFSPDIDRYSTIPIVVKVSTNENDSETDDIVNSRRGTELQWLHECARVAQRERDARIGLRFCFLSYLEVLKIIASGSEVLTENGLVMNSGNSLWLKVIRDGEWDS